MSGSLLPGVRAALNELSSVTSLQGLQALANTLSASATSTNLVLYSNLLSNGIKLSQVAPAIAAQLDPSHLAQSV